MSEVVYFKDVTEVRLEIDRVGLKRQRIAGLDSIRLICALIVVIDHLGFAQFWMHTKPAAGAGRAMYGLLACLFNGPAAVIAFFIISGFCIHYPFRDSPSISLPQYFSRRLIRIGLPSLVFMGYLRLVLKDASALSDTVLWSVFCEIIYYLLYPFLLFCRRRVGWLWLIAAAFAAAFALSLSHLQLLAAGANSYIALGASRTWLIGLPCWLLGCWLAENYQRLTLLSVPRMWMLRALVLLTTIGLRVVKFHVHSPLASNSLTLNLFAVVACFWIGSEMVYLSHHSPNALLEWAGKWSYSIYLAHPLVYLTVFAAGFGSFAMRNQLTHFLLLLAVIVFSYVFFLIIERPSHHLAIQVSRRLARRDAAVIVPA